MRILTTVLAGAVMVLSTGAMAQGMNNGPMGHTDHPMDHPMNNGDRMHDGMDHRDHNGGMHSDNRVEHRDMRGHRWAHNNRHRHCTWTWRHHHRVKVCGWR